ncbi:MAG: hypothetical protein Q4G28_08160 [Neisseria sp.]|nr:hypothetical protein [Neisseria sp.]
MPEILRQSDLATVLPDHFLHEKDHLHLLTPPLQIEGYDKMMAWHERSHHDPAQQWLRQLLYQAADAGRRVA